MTSISSLSSLFPYTSSNSLLDNSLLNNSNSYDDSSSLFSGDTTGLGTDPLSGLGIGSSDGNSNDLLSTLELESMYGDGLGSLSDSDLGLSGLNIASQASDNNDNTSQSSNNLSTILQLVQLLSQSKTGLTTADTTATTTATTTPIPTVAPDPNATTDISDLGGSNTASGDPHYDLTGADGNAIHFTNKGVTGDTYNIFNGNDITINGLYKEWTGHPENPQVIGKIGMNIGNDEIMWDNSGKPTLNGTEIPKNKKITLVDGTVIEYNGSKLTINSSQTNGQVTITANADGVDGFAVNATGNFNNIGGIIGTAIKYSAPLSDDYIQKYFDLSAQDK